MTKIAKTTRQEEEKTAMGQYKSILNKANGGPGAQSTKNSKKKSFFSSNKDENQHPIPCLFLRFLNDVRDDLD